MEKTNFRSLTELSLSIKAKLGGFPPLKISKSCHIIKTSPVKKLKKHATNKWQKKRHKKRLELIDSKRTAVRPNGRTAERPPTKKNCQKSSILKVFCKKKRILRKNLKIRDFKGLFGQKNQNSMSRFFTLLALHFY